MTPSAPELNPGDWRRIRDALRYQARDLHRRSFAVDSSRRELLWEEMDRCLALADQIDAALERIAGLAIDDLPANIKERGDGSGLQPHGGADPQAGCC